MISMRLFEHLSKAAEAATTRRTGAVCARAGGLVGVVNARPRTVANDKVLGCSRGYVVGCAGPERNHLREAGARDVPGGWINNGQTR